MTHFEMDNPLRLPWKVAYKKYWDGSEYVDGIVDCCEYDIVITDCGVHPPTKEQAEAIVLTMNTCFRSHYE